MERALGRQAMPGSVMVIGADSNVGKTFFALNILQAMAEQNHPSVFLSLEDPELELGRRMSQAGYAHPLVHTAFPDPGSVLHDFDEAASGPLKPSCVALDYIQCTGVSVEDLTATIRGIRARARAHGVVALVTSQINALPPGVEDKGIPDYNRLKGTKSIKECADNILMMANGRDRTMVVELKKAKGCPVGARMRYSRGPGGRLIESKVSMDDTDESKED